MAKTTPTTDEAPAAEMPADELLEVTPDETPAEPEPVAVEVPMPTLDERTVAAAAVVRAGLIGWAEQLNGTYRYGNLVEARAALDAAQDIAERFGV